MQDFFRFIKESSTSYQAVNSVKKRLQSEGYEELSEKQVWKLKAGHGYFVTRNDSSLLAFWIPKNEYAGFHMIMTHADSPCFKVKEKPDMQKEGYCLVNVEKYGGMLLDTWFDRPLSLAGRIVVEDQKDAKTGVSLKSVPVDCKKPLFVIPSLAIHMKTDKQEKNSSVQKNMLPLAGLCTQEMDLLQLVADEARVSKEQILGADLFVYNTDEPKLLGMHEEFVSGPRMDDLACVYSGLTALLNSEETSYVKMFGIFDHEEIGSTSLQGARSDFLLRTLRGICPKDLERKLAESFLISADNAHAVHPNYAEKADPTNKPVLNAGIVIKYHGGQKYTTDAYSGAYVKSICKKEKIAYQTYHNHSDIVGGSTLGNLVLQSVSVLAADIGLAQLAMHAACETIGAKDLNEMIRFMKAFYLYEDLSD